MNVRPSSVQRVRAWFARLAHDKRGATAVEYGLIIAVIVIVMVVALVEVGKTTSGIWNNVNTQVQQAH